MAAEEIKNNNVNLNAEKKEENSKIDIPSKPAPPKEPKKGDDVSIKYRGLSYEMALELDHYEEEYFFWDKPVPFGERIKLYPVNVKDYNAFMNSVPCFSLDKKNLPPDAKPEDIKKQLKMTDLEFMISKFEEKEWLYRFTKLIELTMHITPGMKCPHCGEMMSYADYKQAFEKLIQELAEKEQKKEENPSNEGETSNNSGEEETPVIKCPHCNGDGLYETIRYGENEQTHRLELFIDGQKIDFKDFNRLKNIVLFQNLPDYRDTSYIDPHLKKDYETKKRIQGQNSANLTATLEKKLAALKVFMGLPNYDDLYKMTIRKFLIEFATMDDLISYSLQMMGRLCGLGGGGKDAPEHWIYKEIKDVYADGGYVSKDTMMEKLKNVS